MKNLVVATHRRCVAVGNGEIELDHRAFLADGGGRGARGPVETDERAVAAMAEASGDGGGVEGTDDVRDGE